jgi:altronate dehydratase
MALYPIRFNEPVLRYGQVIGFASRDINPGDHVHIDNLKAPETQRPFTFEQSAKPVELVVQGERRTFLGYLRPDGRVGTRNYVAIISTVNCSAHASRLIANHFSPEKLKGFPNVDGVIALTHPYGCTTSINSPDYALLQRTLAGMACHPNVGGFILVGLGCETNQPSALVENCRLCFEGGLLPGSPEILVIQSLGGIRKTMETGIKTVNEMLPVVNAAVRTQQPISELVLALQCGGSDAWSGVTANPVVGLLADELVRQGGTVVLGETPEIFGAEHLLTYRAVDRRVAERLYSMLTWWQEYASRMGIELDDNRSIGNEEGGLTTIYEKSLGAIAKGGNTPLNGVFDYAQKVTKRGLTFMNTPGYDPVAVTGQVAGGCNLVLFTTGRGSVFGFKPAPSIKISTNTDLYERMREDMDINAGAVLDGRSMDVVAEQLFDLVIAVASGQPSKSEEQGVGESEFVPWSISGPL